MKIAIFASIGAQNLGDELILKNEIKILESQYSEILGVERNKIQFTVFSYDTEDIFYQKENIQYKEYFPIGIKNPKNILRNIKNCVVFFKTLISSDLIIIGGGGIIYDTEFQSVGSPLRQWLFRVRVCKIFRKKVEFFRVGINIRNAENLSIIKKVFSNVDRISVRDNYSFELLKKINIDNNIDIENDPVFSDEILSQENTNGDNLKNTLNRGFVINCLQSKKINVDNIGQLNFRGKVIGVSLRKLNIDNYFERILEILELIIDSGGDIVFIPHSFHKTDIVANDYVFLDEFYQILVKKYSKEVSSQKTSITICKNLEESYQIYTERKIDINFAQRLHSIILSQVYKINFIGISYSTKTDEVLKMLQEKNKDIS